MERQTWEIPSPSPQEEETSMKRPEEIDEVLRLHALGFGTRRIAKRTGMSRNTVRSFLRKGGWHPYRKPRRERALDGLEEWLREEFLRHRGNAEVVRQELLRVHGVAVSLRTVERAVAPWRAELKAAARATVRFETPPGSQLQIDFGTRLVEIGGKKEQVKFFVATLGYSRRIFVRAFSHERQSAWFQGLEEAFAHFGGVTRSVLLDNAAALVRRHDVATREVVFNERFRAFARHWGFRPRACAPGRPRTKGKDENGVGYVKRNALAGHAFRSWEALEEHLTWWVREVADARVHGTTGERPIERFQRAEAQALAPLAPRAPFEPTRELARRVNSEACVEVDTNAYSVPWRHIGAYVSVHVRQGVVRVLLGEEELARHAEVGGVRQRVVDPRHLEGVVAARAVCEEKAVPAHPLVRPLAAYEALTGGAWS